MKEKDITDASGFPFRILKALCPPVLYEGVEGDLLEKFDKDERLFGVRKAKRKLFWNAIAFLRPGIILRNKFSGELNTITMLRSFLTITIRSLTKNIEYSIINIAGLAIGIASCILIYNYVQFENSFDQSHPDVDRLYRVNQTAIWSPNGGIMSSSGPQVAHALQNDYPEIEQVLRINTPGDYVVRSAENGGDIKAFRESKVLAADSNFFAFFDFKLNEGDYRTALIGKNKVVLSKEAAKKYFGDKPAVGQMLLFGDERTAVEVTGVTETQPANIHFHFDYLLSISTNENLKRFEWSFIWTQVVTYIKVRPGTNLTALEGKIQTITDRRVAPTFKRLGMDFSDFIRSKGGWNWYLQPVTDIRLESGEIFPRYEEVSDKVYVYILSGVAGFILLIASINFINLSTARATMRAKEVGVKKTLGAFRSSLIAQFQFESIFVTILATVLSLALAAIFKPLIFNLSGFDLPFNLAGNWNLILMIFLLPFVLGFIAGFYPAFYLTAFQPIYVLKGKLASGMKSGGLRNGLVTLQFTIAIALISITLIVFQQLRYISTMNLGLEKENVLLINYAEALGPQIESFRNEISAIDGVVDATVAAQIPGTGTSEDIFSKEGSQENLPINQAKIDDHYFSTLGLKLASGRQFKAGSVADSASVILNENAAQLFGWSPEEALGKFIVYPDKGKLEVVGVVKDFNFRSLHSPISPMLFFTLNSGLWGSERFIAIKFKTQDVSELMEKIEQHWKRLAVATPIEFQFYDELLARQYEDESKLGRLFGVFACFSIGVGIIGLIGLVAYSAEQRKKEIGIRKVFGASVTKIFVMMNSQYIKLIVIALVVATPFAWWAVQQWLDSFEYRIKISPIVFVIAGVSEIVLAVMCVGYLSLRAATLNPSTVLKEE
ncbi:MAG: FtsX-like permease family protein [Cyclobacteriaceae bacterium]|nr:FtsX-like permease family protein [Cyclobacteriaceae bacterium]